jgi:protein-disulfide isomerase
MSLTPAVGREDHVLGDASAAVTLVEYGDYECPHCATAHPIVEALRTAFGPALRFVFRNFPLNEIHPHAEHAAEAAEAAASVSPSAFWAMHAAIFANQEALGDRALAQYGEEAGVPGGVIAAALKAHTYEPRVKSDFESGIRSGVNGTPTFFINGQKHTGAYDLATLRHAVEAAGAHAAHPAG